MKKQRGFAMLKKSLIAKTDAAASEKQIYTNDFVRITYLTSRLIRVERADTATDLPSKTVWLRNFKAGDFKVTQSGSKTVVETEDCIFTIKKYKPHSVYFKDTGKTEIFSRQKNLKGTRRTLDMTYGKVSLEDGLITEKGAYLLDDSKAMLIDENGMFIPRKAGASDYYAFA